MWGQETKMGAVYSECICLYNCAVQSSCVTIFVLPSFLLSLARGQESQELDGCQKRPARHAAETFTSQAGRDTGSDRRRIGAKKKKKVREMFRLFFLFLPVSLLSVSACLSVCSYSLLKPYCICAPLVAGGKCRAGGQDGTGGGGGCGGLWVQRVQLRREINA